MESKAKQVNPVPIPGSTLQVIDNTLVPPYRGIMRVTAKFSDGGSESGTVFPIGPSHVLTAAHTIWSNNLKEFAVSMEISGDDIWDVDVTKKFCEEDEIKKLGRVPTVIDYAVLRVNGAPFLNTTLFIPYVASDAELSAMQVYIPGLPNDLFGMWQAPAGPLSKIESTEVQYKISTVGGMSGAPVIWQQDSPSFRVIAVHSEGTRGNDPHNDGMRITQAKLNKINEWVNSPAD